MATRERSDIDEHRKWNLADIYPGWDAWDDARAALSNGVDAYATLQGSLSQGAGALLHAFQFSDSLGQIAYKVWYFVSLKYDEDQRDNAVNARKQQVQELLARWQQAASWFNPELLRIPIETTREWMQALPDLAVYRFAIEDLYRQQEHVLDEQGEHLLSLAARLAGVPYDSYAALSTSDVKFPTITLADGDDVTVSYAQYRAIIATRRNQDDRRKAFEAMYGTYASSLNTYATLYHGVCQRDWFHARARGYDSTLQAALHGDNIPASVVETLISATREGVEPLRRYHRLRRRMLGVKEYYPFDFSIPLQAYDRRYPYGEVLDDIVRSVAPLGPQYQQWMRQGFDSRWIDVYENAGKRSGAYSAPVYGVHPYMLMNFNDTLDDVFTLAHEMGHSMHTLLSHQRQPFIYSSYTIFVAEVPSTLSEALLLEQMLEQSSDPLERAVLLQHAIDNITSTFYTQVMFADYELQAHRLIEQGEPMTADVLDQLYLDCFSAYYGDSVDTHPLTRITWARIPHFYNSPYYVYQYATCFASAAKLAKQIGEGSEASRAAARERYLELLSSGGSDYPMEQLRRAGVDLGEPSTVRAVVEQLDTLVSRLEHELNSNS